MKMLAGRVRGRNAHVPPLETGRPLSRRMTHAFHDRAPHAASAAILACLLLTGCTGAFPERPPVSFSVAPEPMLIPQEPVARPGMRPIRPPPVPAPICLTDADHLKLEGYFEQLDAWRGLRLGR